MDENWSVFDVDLLHLQGYLLNLIIQYLESEEDDILYGLGLVACVAACQVLRATSFCVIIVFGVETGKNVTFTYIE